MKKNTDELGLDFALFIWLVQCTLETSLWRGFGVMEEIDTVKTIRMF
jgi:hypothetical protein